MSDYLPTDGMAILGYVTVLIVLAFISLAHIAWVERRNTNRRKAAARLARNSMVECSEVGVDTWA